MDLDELQSVRDRERQTDKLQQLRESFYADAGEFIQGLRDRRERAAERADDPFDAPEVNRLSDEIDTAEVTVEAIYEKRVGKVVKAASFAAADLPAEDEGMTREERDLFETLVEDIRSNRQHVLDVLAGEETPTPAEDGPGTATADGGSDAVSAADVMGDADPYPEQPGGSPPKRSDPNPESGSGSDGHESDPAAVDPATGAPAADDPTAGAPDAGDRESADPAGREPGDGEPRAVEPGAGKPVAGKPPVDEDGRPDGGDRPNDPEPGLERPAPDVPPDSSDRGSRESEAGGQPGVERRTVRITDDVGAIYGVDQREYDLSTDDVVQLPAANADPLVEQDAAERLD
jgi:DNA replication factor GINS